MRFLDILLNVTEIFLYPKYYGSELSRTATFMMERLSPIFFDHNL